jgi:hypothetical protein
MDAIVNNGAIGAASGAVAGYIPSLASFVITKEKNLVDTDLTIFIIGSFVGVVGAVGGFIGGAIGSKNPALYGVIGGTLIAPLICSAIIIEDKLTNKKTAERKPLGSPSS